MSRIKTIIVVFIFLISLLGCVSNNPNTSYPLINLDYAFSTGEAKSSSFIFDTKFIKKTTETITIISDTKKTYENPEFIIGRSSYKELLIEPGSLVYTQDYIYTYNSLGELEFKKEVPGSLKLVASNPSMYRYIDNNGTVEVGTTFRVDRSTRYGYDCYGCSIRPEGYSGTASGIFVNAEGAMLADGSWSSDLTYNGYFMVATDSKFPFCTVLEIKNHNYAHELITPGEPFYVVVVDRGGAIQGNKIDLYIGSESNVNTIQLVGSNSEMTMTVISFNSWNPSTRSCGV